MKNILFDFISKYISLTEVEKDVILSLDLFQDKTYVIKHLNSPHQANPFTQHTENATKL